MVKIYDIVKKILENIPEARNSDKLLVTEVLRYGGYIKNVEYFGDKEAVLLSDIIRGSIPSFETITRGRRKVQELYPALQSTSPTVRLRRQQKRETKGTFVFREEM